MKNCSRCLVVFVGAFALVGGVSGCRRASSTQREAPVAPAVQVGPVVQTAVNRTIRVTGTLFGREEAVLSAKVGGRVTDVVLDVDDAARSGDPVIRIDPSEYELAVAERRTALKAALAKLGLADLPGPEFDPGRVPTVERARAEAANADAKLSRARSLFEKIPPLMSEQEFADVRTQAEVARHSAEVELLLANTTLAEAQTQAAVIASAEQRLADTVVRAPAPPSGEPIDYRVAERLVSLGELVAVGQPVSRVVATDTLKFRVQVPERFVSRISKGQIATITVDALTDEFPGVVARVAPRIDPRTRTFEVEIEVANAGASLKPGGFARGTIVTGRDEHVAHVPKEAIVSFAGVSRVFSVRDGKAVEHIVSTGGEHDGLVEIEGEFDAQEVVVNGASGLANGQPVRTVDVGPLR